MPGQGGRHAVGHGLAVADVTPEHVPWSSDEGAAGACLADAVGPRLASLPRPLPRPPERSCCARRGLAWYLAGVSSLPRRPSPVWVISTSDASVPSQGVLAGGERSTKLGVTLRATSARHPDWLLAVRGIEPLAHGPPTRVEGLSPTRPATTCPPPRPRFRNPRGHHYSSTWMSDSQALLLA